VGSVHIETIRVNTYVFSAKTRAFCWAIRSTLRRVGLVNSGDYILHVDVRTSSSGRFREGEAMAIPSRSLLSSASTRSIFGHRFGLAPPSLWTLSKAQASPNVPSNGRSSRTTRLDVSRTKPAKEMRQPQKDSTYTVHLEVRLKTHCDSTRRPHQATGPRARISRPAVVRSRRNHQLAVRTAGSPKMSTGSRHVRLVSTLWLLSSESA
jgi:hypothetical protein